MIFFVDKFCHFFNEKNDKNFEFFFKSVNSTNFDVFKESFIKILISQDLGLGGGSLLLSLEVNVFQCETELKNK
jgi:hypothetical protein